MAPIIMAAGIIAQHVLPALVGKFSGKKGEAIARAVVDSAAAATGIAVRTDADGAVADAESAAARLAHDPALLVQFRARLLDHSEVLERIAADDRRDARARDVAMRAAHGLFANWRADMLALGALLLLWRIIEALLGGQAPIDGAVRDAVMMLFGAVIALVKDVYQFEFGSSRGSKDKSAQLAGER